MGSTSACAWSERSKTWSMSAVTRPLQKWGQWFLFSIVTWDTSWVHHYDPELKSQSLEHCHSTSPRRKISRLNILLENACSQFSGTTAALFTRCARSKVWKSSSTNVKTPKRLNEQISHICQKKKSPMLLEHDNARPLTSAAMSVVTDNVGF
jgi:hypothetical protein